MVNQEPDLILFEEKHATRYFPAGSVELRARAFYRIMQERVHQGYWYVEPKAEVVTHSEEDSALLAMTDEQLSALPNAISTTMLARIASLRAREARAARAHEQEAAWYNQLMELLTLSEDEAVQVMAPNRRRPTSALEVLYDYRADGEYEGYSTEYFG